MEVEEKTKRKQKELEEEIVDTGDLDNEKQFEKLIEPINDTLFNQQSYEDSEKLKIRYLPLERKVAIFKEFTQNQKEHLENLKRKYEKPVDIQADKLRPSKVEFTLSRNGIEERFCIFKVDLEKLKPNADVNDSIMDNYMKFIKLFAMPQEIREKTFFFSTYFMLQIMGDILSKDPEAQNKDNEKKTNEEIRRKVKENYPKIKKWTKKIDIFEMEYLVFPINSNNHWNCLLVLNPNTLRDPVSKCRIIGLDSMFEIKPLYYEVIRTYLHLKLSEPAPEPSLSQSQLLSHSHLNLSSSHLNLSLESTLTHPSPSPLFPPSPSPSPLPSLTPLSSLTPLPWIPGTQVIVPRQTNNHDCGLYTLCYLEAFLCYHLSQEGGNGNLFMQINANTHSKANGQTQTNGHSQGNGNTQGNGHSQIHSNLQGNGQINGEVQNQKDLQVNTQRNTENINGHEGSNVKSTKVEDFKVSECKILYLDLFTRQLVLTMRGELTKLLCSIMDNPPNQQRSMTSLLMYGEKGIEHEIERFFQERRKFIEPSPLNKCRNKNNGNMSDNCLGQMNGEIEERNEEHKDMIDIEMIDESMEGDKIERFYDHIDDEYFFKYCKLSALYNEYGDDNEKEKGESKNEKGNLEKILIRFYLDPDVNYYEQDEPKN